MPWPSSRRTSSMHPSRKLKLVGITGTNGKTSVATLLYRFSGRWATSAALISTVEVRIGQETAARHAHHARPAAPERADGGMLRPACTHCFMEVSSHASCRSASPACISTLGVFTNITHDHLDYHGPSMRTSRRRRLLRQLPPTPRLGERRRRATARDGAEHQGRAALLRAGRHGRPPGTDHREPANGPASQHRRARRFSRLVGEFNASNLLAVYSSAVLLGERPLDVLTALSDLDPPAGVSRSCAGSTGVIGIVDYAHTPDALSNVLTTIAEVCARPREGGDVVGCGGDRDRGKRPVMARIAASMSRATRVLTSDNPRSEDPMAIIDEMRLGLLAADSWRAFVERRSARGHPAGRGDDKARRCGAGRRQRP